MLLFVVPASSHRRASEKRQTSSRSVVSGRSRRRDRTNGGNSRRRLPSFLYGGRTPGERLLISPHQIRPSRVPHRAGQHGAFRGFGSRHRHVTRRAREPLTRPPLSDRHSAAAARARQLFQRSRAIKTHASLLWRTRLACDNLVVGSPHRLTPMQSAWARRQSQLTLPARRWRGGLSDYSAINAATRASA